jgi:hypothetical protein
MMETFSDLKAFIKEHKKPSTILMVVAIVLLVFVALYNYSYFVDRFNPRSRIDFIVYSPNAEQRSLQLVIEKYLEPSFNPFIHRKAKVITNDIYAVGGLITQQKAIDSTLGCSGEFSGQCIIKHTIAGQEYTYTTYSHIVSSGDTYISEWVHFKKGSTDIAVNRNTYADRAITDADWSKYIDSFKQIPQEQLDLPFFSISDKQIPFGA